MGNFEIFQLGNLWNFLNCKFFEIDQFEKFYDFQNYEI